ncbi:MAG TPA: hypothetical protein VGP92_14745 [Acidimicrobiia bacterium]|jgi:hypothetical protein|nr:hypothetical protein [Acidimicrobiia bacterium]
MGALIIVASIAVAIFLWWMRILVTLLREGPTASPEGWLASVVVVTVLGPFGALVYRALRPDRHVAYAPRPRT